MSLFVVNRRKPVQDRDLQDAAFAFQVEMSVTADRPLVSRPNPHAWSSEDWDERLSDLHYRDVAEYATGHNVSSSAELSDGEMYSRQNRVDAAGYGRADGTGRN